MNIVMGQDGSLVAGVVETEKWTAYMASLTDVKDAPGRAGLIAAIAGETGESDG